MLENSLRNGIKLIRFLLCWVYNAVYLPLASIINIGTLRLFYPWLISPMARVWGLGALHLLGTRLEVENREVLDQRSARILIFNHTSTLDVLIAAALFPAGGTAIGKKQIAYIPFLNLAWWAMGFSFLDRENKEKGKIQMNRFCERLLSKKMTIIIAPEGTRSRDGKLLPFKKGAFHVALKSKVPLVPMVIYNAQELMPYQQYLPDAGTIKIKILAPISTEDWTPENLDEKIEEVRQIFLKELVP